MWYSGPFVIAARGGRGHVCISVSALLFTFWLVGLEFSGSVNTINPCPAEPRYILNFQTV